MVSAIGENGFIVKMTEEIQNIEVDSWDVEIPAGDIYYYKLAYSSGYCKLRPDLILSRGPSSQPGKSAFGFWGDTPEEAENLWDKYDMGNRSYDPKFLDLVGRGGYYDVWDAIKALGFSENISEFGWMPASALKKLSDDTRLSWDVTPYRVVKVPLASYSNAFLYGAPVLVLPQSPSHNRGSVWAIYCNTKKEAIRKFEESGLEYSDNDKGFLKYPGVSDIRKFLGNQEVDWCYSDDVTYADTNEKVAWDLPDFSEIVVGDHVEVIADEKLLEDIKIGTTIEIVREYEIISITPDKPFLWNEKYRNGTVEVKPLHGGSNLEFPYSNWRDFLRVIDKNETVSWDVSSIATGWVDSKEDYARLAKPGEVWLLHFGSFEASLIGWYLVFIGDNSHLDGNKFYDGLTIDFYIENEDDDLYLRVEDVRSKDEYTDMSNSSSYFKGIQLDNIGSFSGDGLETLNLYRDQIIQAAMSLYDLHKASWDIESFTTANTMDEFISLAKPGDVWRESEKLGHINDIYVFDYLKKVSDITVDNCSWGDDIDDAYTWYAMTGGCSSIKFPVILVDTFDHLRRQSWDVEIPEYKIYKYDKNGVWYAVVPDELILPYSTGEAGGSDKVAFGIWVENDKEKAIELYHKYLEGNHLSEGFLETLKRREVYYISDVKKDLGIRGNEPEISENKNNVIFSFCNLTSINPVEDTQSRDVGRIGLGDIIINTIDELELYMEPGQKWLRSDGSFLITGENCGVSIKDLRDYFNNHGDVIAPKAYVLRNCVLIHNDYEDIKYFVKHFYLVPENNFPLKLVMDGIDVSNCSIKENELRPSRVAWDVRVPDLIEDETYINEPDYTPSGRWYDVLFSEQVHGTIELLAVCKKQALERIEEGDFDDIESTNSEDFDIHVETLKAIEEE